MDDRKDPKNKKRKPSDSDDDSEDADDSDGPQTPSKKVKKVSIRVYLYPQADCNQSQGTKMLIGRSPMSAGVVVRV